MPMVQTPAVSDVAIPYLLQCCLCFSQTPREVSFHLPRSHDHSHGWTQNTHTSQNPTFQDFQAQTQRHLSPRAWGHLLYTTACRRDKIARKDGGDQLQLDRLYCDRGALQEQHGGESSPRNLLSFFGLNT